MPRRRSRKKLENKKDPDMRRGPKAESFRFNSHDDMEGVATIWNVDYDKALVLVEYADGDIRTYIEKDED